MGALCLVVHLWRILESAIARRLTFVAFAKSHTTSFQRSAHASQFRSHSNVHTHTPILPCLLRTANAHKPTANLNARSPIHSLCSSFLSGGQMQEGGHPSVRELLSCVDSWRACHDSAVDTCWSPHRQLLYRQRCAKRSFLRLLLASPQTASLSTTVRKTLISSLFIRPLFSHDSDFDIS
jgi:hypothetical protein